MTRWGIPIDLIEGPARVFAAMEEDRIYSVSDLMEKAQISSSSCARHVETLCEHKILTRYAGISTRGRPAYYYFITKQKGDQS